MSQKDNPGLEKRKPETQQKAIFIIIQILKKQDNLY